MTPFHLPTRASSLTDLPPLTAARVARATPGHDDSPPCHGRDFYSSAGDAPDLTTLHKKLERLHELHAPVVAEMSLARRLMRTRDISACGKVLMELTTAILDVQNQIERCRDA